MPIRVSLNVSLTPELEQTREAALEELRAQLRFEEIRQLSARRRAQTGK